MKCPAWSFFCVRKGAHLREAEINPVLQIEYVVQKHHFAKI